MSDIREGEMQSVRPTDNCESRNESRNRGLQQQRVMSEDKQPETQSMQHTDGNSRIRIVDDIRAELNEDLHSIMNQAQEICTPLAVCCSTTVTRFCHYQVMPCLISHYTASAVGNTINITWPHSHQDVLTADSQKSKNAQ